MRGKFDEAPMGKWRNRHSIVLVHGYFGYGPDASWVLGNYFEYALQKEVIKNHEEDVYIASISPQQGIHDRACELYQQLIGINEIRQRHGLESTDNGPNLAKAVYGTKHFHEEHT